HSQSIRNRLAHGVLDERVGWLHSEFTLDEPGRQQRPVVSPAQHRMAITQHVETAHPGGDLLGAHRKTKRQPWIGGAFPVAMRDEHRPPGKLLHRLTVGGPRRQRTHCRHRRVVSHPQRRPTTHGMAQQRYRRIPVLVAQLRQSPSGVLHRVSLGLIPSPEAVPQDAHGHTATAVAPVQEPSERHHPQVAQLRPPACPPCKTSTIDRTRAGSIGQRSSIHGAVSVTASTLVTSHNSGSWGSSGGWWRASGRSAGESQFARSGCGRYLPAVLLLSTCGCRLAPATDIDIAGRGEVQCPITPRISTLPWSAQDSAHRSSPTDWPKRANGYACSNAAVPIPLALFPEIPGAWPPTSGTQPLDCTGCS